MRPCDKIRETNLCLNGNIFESFQTFILDQNLNKTGLIK